ncbi:MAG: hypothetical protein CME63_05015 [Halobacteriovoraceae bacterium]|nr:hypothetical protein [Halobacteriovoraceae bacterium]|tara:strand:- start:72990 stop:73526 length:537 start_codon:yes stop_codon:yes gene_type:complete
MKFTLLPFNGLPETNINKQEIPSEMKVEATMSWPQLHLDFQLPSSHLSPTADLSLKERRDELWKDTCFECFILSRKGNYDEWNFNLEGDWQCYQFESYRSPQPPRERKLHTLPEIKREKKGNQLFLKLILPIEQFQRSEIISVHPCVVWKGSHFYAAAHPPEKADFHLDKFYLNWRDA